MGGVEPGVEWGQRFPKKVPHCDMFCRDVGLGSEGNSPSQAHESTSAFLIRSLPASPFTASIGCGAGGGGVVEGGEVDGRGGGRISRSS